MQIDSGRNTYIIPVDSSGGGVGGGGAENPGPRPRGGPRDLPRAVIIYLFSPSFLFGNKTLIVSMVDNLIKYIYIQFVYMT